MAYMTLGFEGNLGGIPERKFTQNGTELMTFSVAVTKGKKDDPNKQTTWLNCTAFDENLFEFLNTVEKGKRVEGKGAFWPRPYETKSGEKRVSYDVTVTEIALKPWVERESVESNGAIPF